MSLTLTLTSYPINQCKWIIGFLLFMQAAYGFKDSNLFDMFAIKNNKFYVCITNIVILILIC